MELSNKNINDVTQDNVQAIAQDRDDCKVVIYSNMSNRVTVCYVKDADNIESIGSYFCKKCEEDDTQLRQDRAFQNAKKSLESFRVKMLKN